MTKDDTRSGAFSPSSATDRPAAARKAALEWAEQMEILDIAGPKFAEAGKAFMGIVGAISDAQFEVTSSDDRTAAASESEGPNV